MQRGNLTLTNGSFSSKCLVHAALWAVAAFAAPAALAQYDLSWNTIDGGGATFSTGGTFSLGGTIGQPDASTPMTGGTFSLTGGFWPGASQAVVCNPCDTNCDGSLNQFDIQPFVESILSHQHPCGTCAGDTNADGTINQFDIQGFVQCLTH